MRRNGNAAARSVGDAPGCNPGDPWAVPGDEPRHEARLRTERVASATSLEKIRTEEIVQLAPTKAVEQVREICNRFVTKFPEFAVANPGLELRAAVSVRHRLVHGYDAVQFDTLWETATRSLREMRRMVEWIPDQAGQDHA